MAISTDFHGTDRREAADSPCRSSGCRRWKQSFLQILVVDVADRDAIAVIDALQQAEKILAATARTDDSVVDLIVRGVDALQKRGRFRLHCFREADGDTGGPAAFTASRRVIPSFFGMEVFLNSS